MFLLLLLLANFQGVVLFKNLPVGFENLLREDKFILINLKLKISDESKDLY